MAVIELKASAAEVQWGTGSNWVGGVAPGEADDVIVNAGFTGKLNLAENKTCKSFDGTGGATGTLQQKTFALIVKGKNAAGYSFRIGTMARTGESAEIRVRGTGFTGEEIGLCDFGALEWDNVIFGAAGEANPHKLMSNLLSKSTVSITTAGTLDCNAKTITAKNFSISGSTTRVLKAKGATFICTSNGGAAWGAATTTGLTFEHDGTTKIVITDGSGSKECFQGGGLNYACIVEFKATAEGVGPGIVGSNTFSGGLQRIVTAANAKLVFPASGSTFLSSGGTHLLSGNVTNGKLEILSATAATQHVLEGTRVFENDYVKLKDIWCKGSGGIFYWGDHSEIISNCDGVIMKTKTTGRINLHRIKLGIITLPSMADADYEAINKKLAPNHMDHMMLFDGWQDVILFSANKAESIKYSAEMIVAWQLSANVQGKTNDGTMGNVATGVLDTYLTESAAACKSYGRPMIIRLAHEFNGNWQSYGNTKETAAKFIEGWRYIVNFFIAKGVTNVKWAWSPNIWHTQHSATVVAAQEFYPGDSYVDFVGTDGYMNLKSPNEMEPEVLHLQNYLELQALAPSKPHYIFEVGVAKDARVTRKFWLRSLWQMVENQMPNCVGICYWARHDAEGTEGDYTLDGSGAGPVTDAEALQNFSLQAAMRPYFKEGVVKYGPRKVKMPSGTIKP